MELVFLGLALGVVRVYKNGSVWKVCVRIQDHSPGAEVCSLCGGPLLRGPLAREAAAPTSNCGRCEGTRRRGASAVGPLELQWTLGGATVCRGLRGGGW